MPPTREELRLATRDRVLDEAGRLFRQRGFANTTIRDIAEASGVSVGTVMATGDKNGLLIQIFDALISTEHAQRGSTAVSPDSTDPADRAERILTLVQPFVTLFSTHQELARAYASTLVSGSHTSTLFTDLAARLVDEIRSVIAGDGDDEASASARAHAIYLAYVGTLFTWSARIDADPAELSDTLRGVFSTIYAPREHSS